MTTIHSFLNQKSTDIFRTAGLGIQKPIEDIDFLTHIPSPLQSFLQDILLPPLPSFNSSSGSSKENNERTITALISHRVNQFEVSTRQHLLSLCHTLLQSNQDAAIVEESIEEILSFIRNVIDAVLHLLYQHCAYSLDMIPIKKSENGNNVDNGQEQQQQQHEGRKVLYEYIVKNGDFRTLPFYLLEDLVDSLPTQTIQLFWNYGPYVWLNDLLCKLPPPFHQCNKKDQEDPTTKNEKSMSAFLQSQKLDLYTRGQYKILKLSKQLLNQLSVASSNVQAQFAGQVSMTLASILPMDDKSGTNNLGFYNTESIVEYESLNDWYKSNNQMDESSSTTSNKNSTISIGSRGNGSGRNKNTNGTNSTTTTLNYDFYQSFWELQRHFTEPDKLIPSEKKGKSAVNANSGWFERMGLFVKRTEAVLGAFEGNKFPNRLVKDMKKRWNDANKRSVSDHSSSIESSTAMDVDTNEDEKKDDITFTNPSSTKKKSNRQYKYMTNSQLLHLQLQDPEIRMHILTQLLIITSFLSQSLKSNKEANEMTVTNLCNELSKLETKAGEILKSTPPNGESQYNALQWVLKERERIWRMWKKEKCQAKIEQHPQQIGEKEDDKDKKKRKMLMSASLGGGAASTGAINKSSLASLADLYSYKIDVKTELPEISMSITKNHKPDLYNFLEDYVEALDPEAGIEEEYHPKNDKVFAWRAMRLLNEKHVGRLGVDKNGHSMINLHNGDFEGIVRKMWKEEKRADIPGDMPVAEEIIDEEDDEEGEDQKVDENNSAIGGGDNKAGANQAAAKGDTTETESLQKVVAIKDENNMEVDESKVDKMVQDNRSSSQSQNQREEESMKSSGQKRKRDDGQVDNEKRGKTDAAIKESQVESSLSGNKVKIEPASDSKPKHKNKESEPSKQKGSMSSSTIQIKKDADEKKEIASQQNKTFSSNVQKSMSGNGSAQVKTESKSNQQSSDKKANQSKHVVPSVSGKAVKTENRINSHRGSNQPAKTQMGQGQQAKSQPEGRQLRSRVNQNAPPLNRRNDDRRGGGGAFQNPRHPPQGRGGGNLPRNTVNEGHHPRGHHPPHPPPHAQNQDNRQNHMNRRGDNGGRRFADNNPQSHAGRFRDDRGRRGNNQGGPGGGPQRRGGGGRR